ncbi:MAG: type II secretion system F family protein [Candidatus Paceibacterota bacterium]
MAIFKYKAIKSTGETYEATREAPDKFALYKELKSEGETVITAIQTGTKKKFDFSSLLRIFTGIKTKDKIMFAKNLGAMMEAGLPMSKSLSIMERQTKNSRFKSVINSINEDVKRGESLSASIGKYPRTFSPIFVSMIKSGEESGNLPNAFKLLAEQMEKNYSLGQKIKGAMIYPAVILCLIAAIGVMMLIYVMPTLTKTFQELKVDLPTSTKVIIFMSEFLTNNLLWVILGTAGIIAIIYFSFKTTKGKRLIDYTILRIPLISTIVKETNTARTARTLSSLLSAGVSLVVSLEVTMDVVQNSYYRDLLKIAVGAIQKGDQMSKIFMEKEFLYPSFMAEMVAVGEETGKLSEMLLSAGTYYENEVEQKTKNMSTIIEPFLMIFIGVAVGFFAIAMISPMYSLSGKI